MLKGGIIINPYSYESIYEFVEENSECKLLNNEYINCKEKLKFKCVCGEIFYTTFDSFKNKNKRECNYCSVEKLRIKETDIKDFINKNACGYSLIGMKYKNNNRKMLYIHISCPNNLHSSYWTNWNSFRSGKRCSKCFHENRTNNPVKWNKESIIKLLEENNLQIVDNNYQFNNAKNKIKCMNKDGFFVDVLINSLQGGTTPSPFKRNRYALDNIMILCEQSGLSLEDDQKWRGIKYKYKAIDSLGYKVVFYPETLLNGSKSRIFHPSNPYTIENIQHYCNINNLQYEVISKEYKKQSEVLLFKYIGNNVPIEEEQRYFYVNLGKFLYDGQRHPIFNQSKGEREIENWLIKNKVNYVPQFKFDDCKHINLLRFDFAILNNKNEIMYLIEYDGIQHYQSVEHFGGKENYIITKERDEIKNNYCKQNNIPLLRIPYWEKSNIDSILNAELFNIIT